ncbi:Phospholipase_D-nuclease N-terminal [Micromonospora nigra]|uniref:Phospholipase_D-nuclease N-terminal n=1 Tax=Micromonospora nigra TaxID=145857 RepID=A0A1C6SIZ3_9ACTN|nr:PLD nuclease N-terminal domain-containing protein [Micromonospora nigra]SCL29441.1 Phospholipase_D-nuclease N-terminal [Micromonospora nigra]
MARVFLLLFAVQVVLAACALISCLSAEKGDVRALPRLAWVLVILLFPLIGPIAWFLAGRQSTAGRLRGGWPTTRGAARRSSRPAAPDDDPEFLRSIEGRTRPQDQELFRRWEEDLGQRGNDLRREDGGPREEPRPEV